ncbi:hypothetical protein [Desulfomonile tiedjei]|uniref:Uncharacterized protein n=1 Tax=Desulfomonile tiedjei (strain ATCC 49306 / DSM 6799 / DCB-1) TaxID=706587 RepID=I4C2G9_DESTA|nr:hypothetical protein [Desulfomonile tiedjei]AFM23760.1 hypothetical protein Desti_1044 [Desulfomonile tiedjei DSM 6799]
MARLGIVLIVCFMMSVSPVSSYAANPEVSDSSYWSALVHEENSLRASVLYLPYMVLMIPVRIIDGIVNPKPATLGTMPPPPHRAHP